MSCESQRQPIYVEYCVSAKGCTKEGQNNSRAHKNKIGTSQPPPKKPKYPDLKRGILWAWGFSCRKNQIPDAHKTGAAISGPKIADKEFYEHGDCSERGGGVIRGAGGGGGGGTGAGRMSGGVCNNCFFSVLPSCHSLGGPS